MEKIVVIGDDITKIHNKILSLHKKVNMYKTGILSIGLRQYNLPNCQVINVSQERILLSKDMVPRLFPSAQQVFIEGYVGGDIDSNLLKKHFSNFKIIDA